MGMAVSTLALPVYSGNWLLSSNPVIQYKQSHDWMCCINLLAFLYDL